MRVRSAADGERVVLAEDRLLELLEAGARLDPELVEQGGARRPVRVERLGLAARAVEREHQLGAERLAQRVLGDERLQLPDELGRAAASRGRPRSAARSPPTCCSSSLAASSGSSQSASAAPRQRPSASLQELGGPSAARSAAPRRRARRSGGRRRRPRRDSPARGSRSPARRATCAGGRRRPAARSRRSRAARRPRARRSGARPRRHVRRSGPARRAARAACHGRQRSSVRRSEPRAGRAARSPPLSFSARLGPEPTLRLAPGWILSSTSRPEAGGGRAMRWRRRKQSQGPEGSGALVRGLGDLRRQRDSGPGPRRGQQRCSFEQSRASPQRAARPAELAFRAPAKAARCS